jgi:predicted CopG family antitoxin
MLLSTWIDKNGGTLKTGKILGIKRNAVYAWRKGLALPRPAAMKAIVKVTHGKVSYTDMIEEYLEKKTKKTGTKKTPAVGITKAGKTLRKELLAKAKSKKKTDPGF